MNLNNVKHGDLKEVFDALEEAFGKLEIDFYMIGAVAREVWYEKGSKQFRRTKDVDFAVLVSNEKQYDAVREYLIGNKIFTAARQNSFAIISPAGIQVDILPFGQIATDTGVQLSGGLGVTSISVDGFLEVCQ